MNVGDWVQAAPLWSVFLASIVLCLAAVVMGTRLGRLSLLRNKKKEPDGPLGSIVGGLSALLAFILGFSFSMTASRFDTRKQLVLDQANALGTTYLRAALVPESPGLEIRQLLREYTDVLVEAKITNVDSALSQIDSLHGQLWNQTKSLVNQDMDSEVRSLFICSLNEVIDLHQMRKTIGLDRRIPGIVWVVLFLLTLLVMLAIGYQVAMSGARRMYGTPVLAMAFSLVILMIADIDRPGEGFMGVSQQPLIDTLESMLRDSP